jgi:hypothetical protein
MRTLPSLVIAPDWSTDDKKRWMVPAERVDPGVCVVYPPEPVDDLTTLISRLRSRAGENDEAPNVQAIVIGNDPDGGHVFICHNGEVTCEDGVGFASIGIGYAHANSQYQGL